MTAIDPKYKIQDHNKQEIRNFSVEKLVAHPTGTGLYNGRVWQLTTDDHLYHYSGGVIYQIANIEDLNKFGTFVGGHDASTGIPTSGSGVNAEGSSDSSIEAGDSWRITTAGTIAGLASGDANLSIGDVLIALVDGASAAGDFMAIQLNLDDSVLDEVQNFTDFATFPVTGEIGVIYITNDTDRAYIWDGAAYKAVSLPNIQHEATFSGFPVTGDLDIFYIADDSNIVYFWDGSAYIPVSGTFTNFYSVDGTLTGNRTVIGDGNSLTFTDILGLTLSSATYDLVTAGNMDEAIGGNKTVVVTGSSSETSAGKTITSTGAGNNISVVTNTDGGFIVPSSSNPDGDVTIPVAGMVKYDSTDDDFRVYQGTSWRSMVNIEHFLNSTAFPVTGNLDIFYIADDTDLVYIWDGVSYQLVGGGSVYANNGTIAAGVARVVTLGTGASFEITGDFVGTLFHLDGNTGKVTMDGLVDPTGLQMTPQAANPGNAQTLWSNSGDSNRPYWGASELSFSGDVTLPLALSNNNTTSGNNISVTAGDYIVAPDSNSAKNVHIDFGTTTRYVAITTDNLGYSTTWTLIDESKAQLAFSNTASFEVSNGFVDVAVGQFRIKSGSTLGFENAGSNAITVGWDSAVSQFKMGTTALGTGTFYEYNPSTTSGRHASSLGVGGTFPGTARFAVRGVGTGTGETVRFEDSAGTDLFVITDNGAAVFNPTGKATADFRVDGDTVANVFFMDASADKIGFGTNTPATLLDIVGGQFRVSQTTDTMSTNAFTINWDEGNNTVIDLEGSTTAVVATLSNPQAGAHYTIKVIQGTNLDTITWPANVLWKGGTAPTITAANNAIDIIQLYYDGVNYLATFTQNFQ